MHTAVTNSIKTLPPAAFAFVMATGIVSVGLHLEGLSGPSTALLWIAGAGFTILLVALAVRARIAPHAAAADLRDPARAFGYFTLVAGANVLGVRLEIAGAVLPGAILLALATLAWILLGYLIPWRVVERADGADLTDTVDGSWFAGVVASQSGSVLAATLQPHARGTPRDILALLAVLSWGTGLGLYLVTGTALVVRVLRHGISAEHLGPAFWVVMGALAISTLAASRLLTMAPSSIGDAIHALAAGVGLTLWAFAAWLVLPLAAMGWWRHVRRRVPLTYNAGLWAMVFPLGMVSVASMALGGADGVPAIDAVGRVFLWVAVTAWLVVALAGVVAGLRAVRAARMAA